MMERFRNAIEDLKDTDRMKRKIKKTLHVDKRMIPAKIVSLLNGMHQGCYSGFFSIFFVSVGLTKFHAGVISGVMYAPPIVSQPFWGYVADKSGKRGLVLAILCIGAIIFFFPLPWIAHIIYPVSTYHCNVTMSGTNNSIANNTDFIKENDNMCPEIFDEERELVLFGVFLALSSVGSLFLVPIVSYIPSLVMGVVQAMPGHVSFGKQTVFMSFGYALSNMIAGEVIKQFESYTSPYTPVFFIYLASVILLIPGGFYMINQAKNATDEATEKNDPAKEEDNELGGDIPVWAMIEQEKLKQIESQNQEFSIPDPEKELRNTSSDEDPGMESIDRRRRKSTDEEFPIPDTDGVVISNTKIVSQNTEEGLRKDSTDKQLDTNWVIRRGSSDEDLSKTDEGMSSGYTNELFHISGPDEATRRGLHNERSDMNRKSIRRRSTIRRMSMVVSGTVDAIKKISRHESVKKRRRSIWSKRIDLQNLQAQYDPKDLRKELFRFLKSFGIIFFLISVLIAGTGNVIAANFTYMLLSEEIDKWRGVDMTIVPSVGMICSALFFPLVDQCIELVKGPIPGLIIGIFFCCVRIGVMSFDIPTYAMIAAQAAEMFAFTLSFTSILEHTHQVTPAHLIMTVDAVVLGMYRSMSALCAGIIGGQIFEMYGGRTLFRGGSILCFGWAFIMFVYYGCKKWIDYLDLDFDEEVEIDVKDAKKVSENKSTKTKISMVSLNKGLVNMQYEA